MTFGNRCAGFPKVFCGLRHRTGQRPARLQAEKSDAAGAFPAVSQIKLAFADGSAELWEAAFTQNKKPGAFASGFLRIFRKREKRGSVDRYFYYDVIIPQDKSREMYKFQT